MHTARAACPGKSACLKYSSLEACCGSSLLHIHYFPFPSILQGPIPECFTQSKTLKHLYLSDNSLSGPLPDFSPDSSLQLLFLRNQIYDSKPSLTGPLPASLATATALQYLQLANNALSGPMVELPAEMK
jgi:hypothetical protein